MERRLILIRHGQTEYNTTGRMQGQLDTPLSAVGISQAREVAAAAVEWNVSHVVASDLERAQDTAKVLADAWGLKVHTDARFRETDLGRWQGGSHQEIDRDYPGQRAYWRHDPHWSPPEGETRLEVAERAFAGVQDLMASDSFSGTVVVVAHGGTIAALTSRLLDIPAQHYPMFTRLGNTCWAELVARPASPFGDEVLDVPRTDPAVDGSIVPVIPAVPTDWWRAPQWFLEGWNVGVSSMSQSAPNPDEGQVK